MEAICKQYYPYSNEPGFFHQTFYTGMTYNYEKIYHENYFWYKVTDVLGRPELFDQDDFNDYFITKSYIRKEKLEKIKNNYKE